MSEERYITSFDNDVPVWYSPFVNVSFPTHTDGLELDLLVSEKEWNKLLIFTSELTRSKVEYITGSVQTGSADETMNYYNEFIKIHDTPTAITKQQSTKNQKTSQKIPSDDDER